MNFHKTYIQNLKNPKKSESKTTEERKGNESKARVNLLKF